MAMFENPNDDLKTIVKWGNYGDVCLLCMRDKMDEDHIDSVRARRELQGLLLNKKIVKIRHSGTDVIICEGHIRKTLKDITGDLVETALDIDPAKMAEFMNEELPEEEIKQAGEVPGIDDREPGQTRRGARHGKTEK